MALYFFLIGPAGSGKSTIGKNIRLKLKLKFFDADNLHSQNNINKMKKGIKLKFRDRLPWLLRINRMLKKHNNSDGKYIIACSALKKRYRNILSKNLNSAYFLYLKCKKTQLVKRIHSRKHFFPLNLINDQIYNFESSEDLININANKNINYVTKIVTRSVKNIINSLNN